jgi:hypothetical protein
VLECLDGNLIQFMKNEDKRALDPRLDRLDPLTALLVTYHVGLALQVTAT